MKQTTKGIYVILILLLGCSKPIECENITINNTKIEYVYNTTIKEINQTIEKECPKTNCPEDKLELIRRLKWFEEQTDKYFNDSECNDSLNKTENKLKDCEDSLCYWNSSWC